MDDTTWQELDDALKTTWKHPLGGTIRVDAAAIDAGDGQTMDAVMGFCRPRFGRRVLAVKGVSGNRPAIQASHTKGSRLFIVGVDGLKGQLTNRLSRGRTVRFSENLEPRFYEELASERLIIRYSRGAPVRQWERIPGRRAESLDATIYALAVRGIVGVDPDRRWNELNTGKPAPAMPAVIRSRWLKK